MNMPMRLLPRPHDMRGKHNGEHREQEKHHRFGGHAHRAHKRGSSKKPPELGGLELMDEPEKPKQESHGCHIRQWTAPAAEHAKMQYECKEAGRRPRPHAG